MLEKKDFESELAHDKSFDTSIRTRRKFFSISELVGERISVHPRLRTTLLTLISKF